jgi:WD40 repeat protein
VNAVAAVPNSRRVVTGDDAAKVAVWDVSLDYPLVRSLSGHSTWLLELPSITFPGRVSAVAVTPDGRHAISGGRDGAIKVWEIT